MAIFEFPGAPKDIVVPYEQMITDGKNINLNPWSVENPHPGFGTDPNILNEYGHTEYPMWVDDPNVPGNRVIVKDKAEYEALLNAAKPAAAVNNGWG